MTVVGNSSGPGSKSSVKIFANIFISFIGAGVLGLPFAFKEAGLIEGTIVMTLVGAVSVKAMLLLIDCKYRILEKFKPPVKKSSDNQKEIIPEDMECLLEGDNESAVDMELDPKGSQEPANTEITYGDVGFQAIGSTGRVLVDFAIVVSQVGFCCAYIIFITENLSAYFPSIKLWAWLIILLPPICLMTLARHLGVLSFTSLLAQCSNLLAFAVVLWFDFEHFHSIQVHPKYWKVKGLPFFLAISIYCYEGAGMILHLESSVAEEVRHKFKRFFLITIIFVTTLYVSFGTCGYASFGPLTNQIITLNLPQGASVDFAMIVKSCLCLALFFTYPVMMFPVTGILDRYIFNDPEKNYHKGNLLRIGMVLLTGFIVLAIPSFSSIMALVGATCCTLLAFTLPGLFHMTIFRGSLSKMQVCFDWFLIGLGIVGAVIGTLDTVNRLANPAVGHSHPGGHHAAKDILANFTDIASTSSP